MSAVMEPGEVTKVGTGMQGEANPSLLTTTLYDVIAVCFVREEYHMPRLSGQLLAQDGTVVLRDVEFDIQLSPGVRPGWAATFALPLPSGFDPNSLPQTFPFTIQLQDGRIGAVVLSGVHPASHPGTWNFQCVGREPLQ